MAKIKGKKAVKNTKMAISEPIKDDDNDGSLVECPSCKHNFHLLSNAESFSMVKCPSCKRWFHVHIRLGEDPNEYLSPDDFEKEVEEEEWVDEEEPDNQTSL